MKRILRQSAQSITSDALTGLLVAGLCVILSSCRQTDVDNPIDRAPVIPAQAATTQNSQEDSITLPHDEPEFPPGPGRETFIARCMVCHSLRYISMQPDFPEKTWTKEVEKMKSTWGAHITDAEAKEIIAYLVQVKGKKL